MLAADLPSGSFLMNPTANAAAAGKVGLALTGGDG
jgi:hypothetical protein